MNDRRHSPSDARIQDTDSPDEKRTAIIVLGMHRAGSAMLTKLLAARGCTVSRTTGDIDHRLEAIRFFDDEMLEQAGSSWADWQPMQEDWSRAPTYRPNVRKAGQLLEREFGDAPLFAIGDPRICRIAPFWFEVFDSRNVEPIVLLPIRHPLSVAAALEGDGLPSPTGQLLWLRHVLDAEATSRGRRRMFVRYTDLFDDGMGLTDRIAENMGLVWPRSRAAFAADMMDIVARDAGHPFDASVDPLDDHIQSGWLRDTYAVMSDWAREGEDADAYAKLDAVRRSFDEAGANFAYAIDTLSRSDYGPSVAGRRVHGSAGGVPERFTSWASTRRENSLAPMSSNVRRDPTEADVRLDRLGMQLAAAHDEIARVAARADAVAREDETRTENFARLRATIDTRDATIEETTRQLRLKIREIDDLQRQVEQFVTGRRTPAMTNITDMVASSDHRGGMAQPHPRIGQDDLMLQQAFLEALRSIANVLSMPGKWWWAFLPSGWTWRLRNRALRRKGLFDAEFYRKRYPDVAQAGLDPLNHYILHGLEEGRLRS